MRRLVKSDRTKPGPKSGDWVAVRWQDIVASVDGDPKSACLHSWDQPLIFVEFAERNEVKVAIFRMADVEDEDCADSGYTCIPVACIESMTLLTAGQVLFKRS